MGTRGLFGFRYAGKDYLTYNAMDSYPSGLGVVVARFIQNRLVTLDGQLSKATSKIKAKIAKIVLIDVDKRPTPEQIKKLKKYADLTVSEQSYTDWYCLLRKCQGDLAKIIASGVMNDNSSFAADSLFCEWAYVINFDTDKLEVYKGFQRKPHKKGRYASMKVEPNNCGNMYYPIALIKQIPFAKATPEAIMALEKVKVEEEAEVS